MTKTLPGFGKGSRSDEQGCDLAFMIGWLEDMVEYESEICDIPGPFKDRRARLEQAEDALELLRQVEEWTPRLTKAYLAKVKAGKCPPSARSARVLAKGGDK